MDTNKSYEEIVRNSGVASMLAEASKDINWFFEGLIEDDRERGHQWLITGEPKAGKSRLAMQLAVSAAAGKDFLGFRCSKAIKVLYFNFELSKRVSAKRVLEYFGGNKDCMKQVSDRLFVVSEWQSVNVLDEKQAQYISLLVDSVNPDLIVWDVLKRMSLVDENSNVDMSRVMYAVRRISSKRTHIVVHHSRKEQYEKNAGARGIRGASSIHAEVDGVISVAEFKKKHTVKFSARSVQKLDDIDLIQDGICFARGEQKEQKEKKKPRVDIVIAIKEYFSEKSWISRQELHSKMKCHLGIEEAAIDRRVNSLVDSGVLQKRLEGRKMYYSVGVDGSE